MKISPVTKCIIASCIIFPHASYAEENKGKGDFSTLTISSSKNAKENEVGSSAESYREPGAVSSRRLNTNAQSLDASLRSMAGSYTQLDPLQGAVTVNIRGMSGLGRVNTMVDGVTQTYYGMAPTSYHAGTNSSAGVLIDPNFLAEVDLVRGTSAGSQGVNALAGSANMRTIGVDDVVRAGNHAGVLSRFSIGNNGMGRSGMVTVAGKTEAFGEGGSIGGLIGTSGSTTYATYKNGGGRSSKDFIGDDNKFMRQNPQSQLYKLDMSFDAYNKLQLSARNYTNTFTQRDITSDDYYANYRYAPQNELIDFNILASTSRTEQKYAIGSMYNFNDARLSNRSNALDINNTSRFALGDNTLSILIGGKMMQTEYTRQFTQESPTMSNAFSPAGKQNLQSLYTDVTLQRGIWQLDLGLNYTHSEVKGFKPACAENVNCFPQGASTLDLRDDAFNPSATLSAQVTPWLQPFVTYSHSSRAPNVQEAFFANEGGASMNPFLKPERAQTWQAGFNIVKQGLITDDDSLHIKALAYQTRVKRYITSESFFLCYDGSLCKDIDNSSDSFNANIAINSLTPVKSEGYEIEASYDMGYAYANISWSKQHTNQPTSIASTTQSFGIDDMSDLPRTYATLDIGTRLFERKLTLGALVKYTGQSKRLSTEGFDVDTNTTPKEKMPKIPTIVDLYANYAINDNFTLKFGVQNLGNKDYAEALNRINQDLSYAQEGASVNTTARGRTWVFGGEVHF